MVKRVGRYEIHRTLGEGTFGKVKLAINTDTNDQVAIKILDKEKIQRQNMGAQIKKEISIMKMIRHRNVVQLREVLASRTKIFIVLELVTGGELFDKIVSMGKLTEDVALYYFRQLIDGVEYCHARGVCHRDLKPENLLLDAAGNLKISDFGLSALYQNVNPDDQGANRVELLHTTCGTPNYVAPEVLADQGYDGRKADIWSCGVILYVLLSGFLPFDESTMAALFRKIQSAEFSYPVWFSSEVRSLIDSILVANPARRSSLVDVKTHVWYIRGEETDILCSSFVSQVAASASASIPLNGPDDDDDDMDGDDDDAGGSSKKQIAAASESKKSNAPPVVSDDKSAVKASKKVSQIDTSASTSQIKGNDAAVTSVGQAAASSSPRINQPADSTQPRRNSATSDPPPSSSSSGSKSGTSNRNPPASTSMATTATDSFSTSSSASIKSQPLTPTMPNSPVLTAQSSSSSSQPLPLVSAMLQSTREPPAVKPTSTGSGNNGSRHQQHQDEPTVEQVEAAVENAEESGMDDDDGEEDDEDYYNARLDYSNSVTIKTIVTRNPLASEVIIPHVAKKTDSSKDLSHRGSGSSLIGGRKLRRLNALDVIDLCGGFAVDRMFVKEKNVKRVFHFMSQEEPDEILSQLATALRELGCDVHIFDDVFKIKATLLTPKGLIGVVFLMYSLVDTAVRVIEIRRGKGDILEFHSFYHRLHAKIIHLISAHENSSAI